MARKSGLGRGLSALIPQGDDRDERIPVTEVHIDSVTPNPHQPRITISDSDLGELTESVREHGVIQPLLVSEQMTDDNAAVYQLIAGERRLRAARAAGLTHVPVTIRQSTDQQLLELALIENIQRLDLGPLEEALAYQRLIEDFDLTQVEVANRVGRSRTAVANTLRLLDLNDDLRQSLASGEITEGHARALLGLSDPEQQRQTWREVVERNLNVRQTERIVRDSRRKDGTAVRRIRTADPEVEAVAESLRRSLDTKVTLRRSKRGTGSVTIYFYSDEELDGLLERLVSEERL